MHNEERHGFVILNKYQRSDRFSMIWASHMARMGKSGGAYGLVVGKSEEKRRRWNNNI